MLNLPNYALKLAYGTNRRFQFFRVSMDGVATHTLRTGNQFQVFQHDSGFVTVDEAHALAGWDWAVVLLPEEYMNGNPIRRWVTGVSYLALQITVGSPCAPDR
ncbi:hypothetical protein EY04_23730 [Pseudomonas chlororaphis]|nr:hypothetical protein EY04_23730 [Pseudomonas chlororaphis]